MNPMTPFEAIVDAVNQQKWTTLKVVLMAHPHLGILPILAQKRSFRSTPIAYFDKFAPEALYQDARCMDHYKNQLNTLKHLDFLLSLTVRCIYERYLSHFFRISKTHVHLPNHQALIQSLSEQWARKYVQHTQFFYQLAPCPSQCPKESLLLLTAKDLIEHVQEYYPICPQTRNALLQHTLDFNSAGPSLVLLNTLEPAAFLARSLSLAQTYYLDTFVTQKSPDAGYKLLRGAL